MGKFFNEIMKGQKFIPRKMEQMRQEFRNRPPVAVAEPPAPEKKWNQMNAAERKAYQERKNG